MADARVSAAVSSLPGLLRFSSGRYDCLPLLVLTLAALEMVAFPTFGAIPTQRKYLCTRDLIYRPHACSALVLAIIFLFPRARNSPVILVDCDCPCVLLEFLRVCDHAVLPLLPHRIYLGILTLPPSFTPCYFLHSPARPVRHAFCIYHITGPGGFRVALTNK